MNIITTLVSKLSIQLAYEVYRTSQTVGPWLSIIEAGHCCWKRESIFCLSHHAATSTDASVRAVDVGFPSVCYSHPLLPVQQRSARQSALPSTAHPAPHIAHKDSAWAQHSHTCCRQLPHVHLVTHFIPDYKRPLVCVASAPHFYSPRFQGYPDRNLERKRAYLDSHTISEPPA